MGVEAQTPEDRFREFLASFRTDSGEYKYRRRIAQMSLMGKKSVVVDFDDLLSYDQEFARMLVERPDEYLNHANRAVLEQLRYEDPFYADEVKTVYARFKGLPQRVSIRDISSRHIRKLVMFDGIVVRATPIKPLLTRAVYVCKDCGAIYEKTPSGRFGVTPTPPLVCRSCGKRGRLEFDEESSSFIDFQEIRVQERPEDLPPGQLPRSIDVLLFEDLVDSARPGDRVSITGVVRVLEESGVRRGRPKGFELLIEANYVDVAGREADVVTISPEEEQQILELAKQSDIHKKIIASIAPSIYGHEVIKEAVMYLLFGGVPKNLPDGVTIRGDINVLLVGDPGTAKSQLLQYVARIAPRGLYTSGRGTTAAGLTAAVVRDRMGGMALEAGALVLADKGICAIDEFDKMRPEDRVAIHEAMEQQTVSVAKGGIVATLNARAAILAAANPALGRYDAHRTISENINLPSTILSRFDLIFIMRDEPEREEDKRMTRHILSLHRGEEGLPEPPIPPELLRKYISYAKQINPKLTKEAMEKLESFYLEMRRASEHADSPIAITPRQLESLVRLAEARARAALRDVVLAEDAEAAIEIMKESLRQVGIDVTTGKADIDVIMTGKPKSLRDKLSIVLTTLVGMEKESPIGMVAVEELYERLKTEYDFPREDFNRLLKQLLREGTIYEPREGFVKKT